MHDLGTLGGVGCLNCRSAAFAINNIGQIVGESEIVHGSPTHAFLYRVQAGVMQDLNHALSLLDQVTWELTDARGINDLGQIVGTGQYLGLTRAYRLDPPPFRLAANVERLLEIFNLADRGLDQSLRSKLRAIQGALARSNLPAACGQTDAFDNEVRAQVGRGLTQSQATKLTAGAALLRRDLECR